MAKPEVLPKRLDVLDVADPACSFRVNVDVINEAFGAECNPPYMRAVYPRKESEILWEKNTKERLIVWMPKLYGNSSEWRNTLSEDGTKIYEVAEGKRTHDWTEDGFDPDLLRLVFVQKKAKEPYVFVGAFKIEKLEHCNHVFSRIATKVRLIGQHVKFVEVLDDNR